MIKQKPGYELGLVLPARIKPWLVEARRMDPAMAATLMMGCEISWEEAMVDMDLMEVCVESLSNDLAGR